MIVNCPLLRKLLERPIKSHVNWLLPLAPPSQMAQCTPIPRDNIMLRQWSMESAKHSLLPCSLPLWPAIPCYCCRMLHFREKMTTFLRILKVNHLQMQRIWNHLTTLHKQERETILFVTFAMLYLVSNLIPPPLNFAFILIPNGMGFCYLHILIETETDSYDWSLRPKWLP